MICFTFLRAISLTKVGFGSFYHLGCHDIVTLIHGDMVKMSWVRFPRRTRKADVAWQSSFKIDSVLFLS